MLAKEKNFLDIFCASLFFSLVFCLLEGWWAGEERPLQIYNLALKHCFLFVGVAWKSQENETLKFSLWRNMAIRKNYMSVILSGLDWAAELQTTSPTSLVITRGDVGVLLLDGLQPVGGKQETLHKLQASRTSASLEASAEMTYLHTDLPLYKSVSDPWPRPTLQSCTDCTAGLSSFQQRVKCGTLNL